MALSERSRPTKSEVTMWGNMTMSRRGRRGSLSCSGPSSGSTAAARGVRGLRAGFSAGSGSPPVLAFALDERLVAVCSISSSTSPDSSASISPSASWPLPEELMPMMSSMMPGTSERSFFLRAIISLSIDYDVHCTGWGGRWQALKPPTLSDMVRYSSGKRQDAKTQRLYCIGRPGGALRSHPAARADEEETAKTPRRQGLIVLAGRDVPAGLGGWRARRETEPPRQQ